MAKVLHHCVGIDFADRADLELAFPFVFPARQEPPEQGRGLPSAPPPQSRQALVDGLTGEGNPILRRARRRQSTSTPAGQIAESAEKLLAFKIALKLGFVTRTQFRQNLKFIFRHGRMVTLSFCDNNDHQLQSHDSSDLQVNILRLLALANSRCPEPAF
jgi:hypothetical protein